MSDHVLTAALRGLREMVIATGDSKCRDCHACQLDVILEALNAAIAAARSCDKCQSTYSCKVQAPAASDTESASESESEDDDADQPITAGAKVVCFAAPVQSKASQDDEDEDTESEDEDDESESDDNECDK